MYLCLVLQGFTGSLTQLGLLGLILAVPLSVLPSPLLWLYDLVLWSSEPVLQIVETIGAIKLTMSVSREVIDRMDDQPALAKVTEL